jgi:hypothetical protein
MEYDGDRFAHQPLGRRAWCPRPMRSHLLRIILAAFVLATATSKVWGPRLATDPDIRSTTIAVLALKGWPAYEQPSDASQILDAPIYFEAPGCEEAAQIFLTNVNLQKMPLLDQTIKAGYTRRIVYMGRTWLSEDRLGMRLVWLKHKVLSLFGLGRYVASSTALVIAEPADCRAADLLDWGLAWDRQMLASISTNDRL